jgi:hypothetical protein
MFWVLKVTINNQFITVNKIKYNLIYFNFKFHDNKIVIVIKKIDNIINNKLKLSNNK